MPTIILDQFAPILVNAGTYDSVTVSIDSSTNMPTAEILGMPVVEYSMSENTRRLVPNPAWVPGTSFSVYINGALTGTSYIVREDSYSYRPYEYLYSKGILDSASLETMLENSFLTQEEYELLSSMGPELTESMSAMSDGLCDRFYYKGIRAPSDVRVAVCFRVMQQILYTLGMGSFIESVLLSPGPSRSWYNKTYISFRKVDSEVKELFPIVKTHADAARAAISKAGLNTEVIDSVSLQVPPTHPLHDLAVGIATLFCAIRYTHDNDRFSY